MREGLEGEGETGKEGAGREKRKVEERDSDRGRQTVVYDNRLNNKIRTAKQ